MATTTRRPSRSSDFFATYTRDLTREGVERLFTRDARDAYRFFTRGMDQRALAQLPWHQRVATAVHHFFLAFTQKLTPPRRALYGREPGRHALGLMETFRGFSVKWVPAAIFFDVPMLVPAWAAGSGLLLIGFVLLKLRVGSPREAVLAAWAITWEGEKVLLHVAPGTKESTECW